MIDFGVVEVESGRFVGIVLLGWDWFGRLGGKGNPASRVSKN